MLFQWLGLYVQTYVIKIIIVVVVVVVIAALFSFVFVIQSKTVFAVHALDITLVISQNHAFHALHRFLYLSDHSLRLSDLFN